MSGAPRLLLLALLLVGCRDSPAEVITEASEAASSGDMVEMRELFSVATQQRLEQAWRLSNQTPESGWSDLAGKLTFSGEPISVVDETIHGEYARVDAEAGTERRDYYLRKEDGKWRIELGAGIRYRREAAKALAKEGGEGKEGEDGKKDEAKSD